MGSKGEVCVSVRQCVSASVRQCVKVLGVGCLEGGPELAGIGASFGGGERALGGMGPTAFLQTQPLLS